MRKSAVIILILILWALPTAAQEQSLSLMQSRTSVLGEAFPTEDWAYTPGETDSTVVVEALSGSLDPTLELLDADGESIEHSEDFAPAFSTAARLHVPPGGPYTLRVAASFGEGDYRITALPGSMHRQWNDTPSADSPFWQIARTAPAAEGVLLEPDIATTRLFAPVGAFPQRDLYIQSAFRFQMTRPDTVAGLLVRGAAQANGQVTGLRFEVAPDGAWSLWRNDIAGSETTLADGTLAGLDDGLTLGMLAQGTRVAVFADGVPLAEVESEALSDESGWGVTVFDGSVLLEAFWIGTPADPAPAYPTHLENWAAASGDIAAELVERGLVDEGGVQMLGVPMTAYTVNGMQQRNFLITEADVYFDDLVIGGDVRLVEGADVGCGLLTQFNGRENRLLAYVDSLAGGGLLWWKDARLMHNNYAMIDSLPTEDHRLLLIMQGHFVTLYVNGNLLAQELVPRRGGNVGVGFVNFVDDTASCEFRDVWVWG